MSATEVMVNSEVKLQDLECGDVLVQIVPQFPHFIILPRYGYLSISIYREIA